MDRDGHAFLQALAEIVAFQQPGDGVLAARRMISKLESFPSQRELKSMRVFRG